MQSIIESGLIAGGKNASQDRQAVFFTAMHPLGHSLSQAERIRCDRAPSTPRCSVLDRY